MAPSRLAACLGALSLSADDANGFPPEKVLRTVLLAVGLHDVFGGDPAERRAVWWTPLLRYLGCTAYAWEEGARYGAGDDRSVRHTMVLADPADPVGTVRRVVSGVAPRAPLTARVAAVARLLGDGRAVAEHSAACVEGSSWLARVAGFTDELVAPLHFLDARWDGRGQPDGVGGADIPCCVRLYQLADIAEVVWHRDGTDLALATIERRAGAHLDPELCRAFAEHGRTLLDRLTGPSVWESFLDSEPAPQAWADDDRLDGVCLAFAHFSDVKSPWFLGHSPGVARLATKAGQLLGLSVDERMSLKRAALLHDLGRVGVNNAIWEKPGPLGYAEWEAARGHAVRTERILAATPLLRPLAALASAGHERLDGSGYHRSLPASVIPLEARILAAADARQALGEARPHRPAHAPEEAAKRLAEQVAAGSLDAEAVRAVLMAAGHPDDAVPTTNPAGLSDREVEVLVLVARGLSNKQIGGALGISPKTVQHHVAHVYDAIGVRTRAAAALFVADRGLLGRAPS